MKSTIAEKIGYFVVNSSYDKFPKEVIEKAKCCLINGIAMGMSSYQNGYARMARELIKREELGNPSMKGATIFCDGSKVTTMGAAFANAVLFTGRAQGDTIGSSHFGIVVLPTVLALAESNECEGIRVLEAIIVGYETGAALDRIASIYTTPRGFRGSSIFGIFASAAAACKLLGLTEEETVNAIGFAAAFASGTLECWIAGTSEWRFEVGIASREGIIASLLSREGAESARSAIEGKAGFLNAFANTTEGVETMAISSGIWSITKTTFSLFPICDLNQTPVRTILSLMKENHLSDKDIKKILVKVNPQEYQYAGVAYRGPFDSADATLMSTPFCLALGSIDGQVTLEGLSRFKDQKINEMINNIEHLPDEKIQSYCCAMTIVTKDGRIFHKESKEGLEYFYFNIDRTIQLAKQVTMEVGIPEDKANQMTDMIRNLDQAPNMRKLVEFLGTCP